MKEKIKNQTFRNRKYFRNQKGFTLIEMIVVVAIIGILGMAAVPSILNSVEVRDLENSTREILTTIQRAKFQAVKTKLNHRVRFSNDLGYWEVFMEREETPATWSAVPGYIRKVIPSKFNATINLPGVLSVELSPLGFVMNYDSSNNTIILQSDKIKQAQQPDERQLRVLAGGTLKYYKTSSTG